MWLRSVPGKGEVMDPCAGHKQRLQTLQTPPQMEASNPPVYLAVLQEEEKKKHPVSEGNTVKKEKINTEDGKIIMKVCWMHSQQ